LTLFLVFFSLSLYRRILYNPFNNHLAYTDEYYRTNNPNAELVKDLNNKFLRAKSASTTWRENGVVYEGLVNSDLEGTNTQLTKIQLDELKRKYGIPLSANVLYAMKEQIQAFLTANNPSVTPIPIGQSSKEFAYVWRELITGTFRLNKLQKQLRRAIGDAVTVGHGALIVEPNNFFSSNEFNCNIRRVRWEYIYVDNFSESDDNYADAEFMVITKPLPKSKAKKLYKLTDDEMKFAQSNLQDTYSPTTTQKGGQGYPATELIWVQEFYLKTEATCYLMQDGTRSCDPNKANQSIANFDDTFIQKIIKCGNYIKHQEIMPVKEYPIVFIVFDHCDNPTPQGIVQKVAHIQKAINRAIGITIEHAQKTSNAGMIASEGAITNKDQFATDMSTPGGIAEYQFDPSLPNGGVPIFKQPQPLNQAWFTLFKELIQLMEYITGMNDILRGSTENAAPTATQQNQLAGMGTMRIKMKAKSIDESLETLCNLVIQYMQAYSPQDNLLRYIGDTDAMISIRTDVQGAVRQSVGEDGKLTQDFFEQEGGQQLATIITNETNNRVIKIVGALKLGDYRVAVASTANLPTTRMMAQQVIQTVMSRMSNDPTTIALMKASLKLIDIPDIDNILGEADEVAQQNQQLQQLQKELEKTILDNENLKQEVLKQKENVILAQIQEAVTQMKAEHKVNMAHLKESIKDRNAEQKQAEREANANAS